MAAFFARSYFSTVPFTLVCFLLLSPLVFAFPNDFFALLLASLLFLTFLWTHHQHFYTLFYHKKKEDRKMRPCGRFRACLSSPPPSLSIYLSIHPSIYLSLSFSIANRVEVFSARSSLNYSWKCQIRRPFSVRAYGNDDKSDLTAVFLPAENVRWPNLRSPSLFLSFSSFFSIIFFFLSLSFHFLYLY